MLPLVLGIVKFVGACVSALAEALVACCLSRAVYTSPWFPSAVSTSSGASSRSCISWFFLPKTFLARLSRLLIAMMVAAIARRAYHTPKRRAQESRAECREKGPARGFLA